MPEYKYIGMDAKGRESSGTIRADSRSRAMALIKEKGVFPTSIDELGGDAKAPARSRAPDPKKGLQSEIRLPGFMAKMLIPRVKPRQLTTFTRQLAIVLDAGLPLLRGLHTLRKQERHPALKACLIGLSDSVESGTTFSEALGQFPKIFNKLFVNMVKAGEAGGILDQILLRLAEFMEKGERIRNKIRGALVYPIVVLVMAIAILTFLLLVIIPKFEVIFSDLLEGKPLPLLTQWVVGASKGLKEHYIIIAIVIGVFVFAGRFWRKTKSGAYIMDAVRLRMPIFGILFRKAAIARFARTLGTLMSSGVPVLQALNIVRETAGNQVVAKAIQQVHDSVKEGDTMAEPLAASKVFPDIVIGMVDVGEETGALPEMLIKIAEAYDDEVDTTVEGLTSVIEPLMIVFLAVIVGVIVIAMFLPLISIIGGLTQ